MVLVRAASRSRAAPDGLHTPVGAEGKFLSGGQRQATMLLRALFSVAPIILLDEPTSNLDPESKNILMKAIQRAGEGRRRHGEGELGWGEGASAVFIAQCCTAPSATPLRG